MLSNAIADSNHLALLRRAAAVEEVHARTAIYTQDTVVQRLLDMLAWPTGGRRLVDTSCGDGSFLGAALKRLLAREPDLDGDGIVHVIEGWDIHPRAVEHARERLIRMLVSAGRSEDCAVRLACRIVNEGDFLTEAPSHSRYDCVVGNPPYLRMTKVPDPLRSDYRLVMPPYARQDLLHSFMDKCASCLLPGGEIAFVSADRWLFNAAAAELRERLGRRLGIHHLKRLDVTSSFYRPKYRKAGSPPRVHPVGIVLRPREQCSQYLGQEPIYPGEHLVTAVPANRTLSDIATVRLGPWLGTKGVFLVDAAKASTLPPEYLVPTVDSRDLISGAAVPRQFAVRTNGRSDPHPQVMAHLLETLPSMCKRGRRIPAWAPPESIEGFDISTECLVVPRIGKGLKAYRVEPGKLPINYNLVLTPKPGYTLSELEAAIAASSAQTWAKLRGHPLEGGYIQVSAKLLRELPC